MGPILGAKIGPQMELAASAVFHVEHRSGNGNTHALRKSHQLPTAVGEPWGYVDMVLASMRFPYLSLGPTNVTQRKKPFAASRRFVWRELPSLVAPLASWFRTSGLSKKKETNGIHPASSFQRARFLVPTVVCVCGNQSPKLLPFRAMH